MQIPSHLEDFQLLQLQEVEYTPYLSLAFHDHTLSSQTHNADEPVERCLTINQLFDALEVTAFLIRHIIESHTQIVP